VLAESDIPVGVFSEVCVLERSLRMSVVDEKFLMVEE